jgi:hypothetical protein
LARRFTAEAGLGLVDALVAENRTAVLLMLDPSPDIATRVSRQARKSRKKSGRQLAIQWGFSDDSQANCPLDRSVIAEHLRELGVRYEFVVVVLPPLTQFAHATAVAPAVEGVVAIGIYHQTRRRDLEEHMAEIDRTGATSLGAAFARRTLIPHRSGPTTAPPTEAPESTSSDVVAEAEIGKQRSLSLR